MSYDIIHLISRVSRQKGPICHAQAWWVWTFWQDTLDIFLSTSDSQELILWLEQNKARQNRMNRMHNIWVFNCFIIRRPFLSESHMPWHTTGTKIQTVTCYMSSKWIHKYTVAMEYQETIVSEHKGPICKKKIRIHLSESWEISNQIPTPNPNPKCYDGQLKVPIFSTTSFD